MELEALKTFSGVISKKKGQVWDEKDSKLSKDLIAAGYAKPIKKEKKTATVKNKGTAAK